MKKVEKFYEIMKKKIINVNFNSENYKKLIKLVKKR